MDVLLRKLHAQAQAIYASPLRTNLYDANTPTDFIAELLSDGVLRNIYSKACDNRSDFTFQHVQKFTLAHLETISDFQVFGLHAVSESFEEFSKACSPHFQHRTGSVVIDLLGQLFERQEYLILRLKSLEDILTQQRYQDIEDLEAVSATISSFSQPKALSTGAAGADDDGSALGSSLAQFGEGEGESYSGGAEMDCEEDNTSSDLQPPFQGLRSAPRSGEGHSVDYLLDPRSTQG